VGVADDAAPVTRFSACGIWVQVPPIRGLVPGDDGGLRWCSRHGIWEDTARRQVRVRHEVCMPSSLSPSSRLRACPERAGSNEEDYCHRGHAAHARQYVCRNCGSQLGQRVRAEWDRVHPGRHIPPPERSGLQQLRRVQSRMDRIGCAAPLQGVGKVRADGDLGGLRHAGIGR
jgi:hypothetical protein